MHEIAIGFAIGADSIGGKAVVGVAHGDCITLVRCIPMVSQTLLKR